LRTKGRRGKMEGWRPEKKKTNRPSLRNSTQVGRKKRGGAKGGGGRTTVRVL